MASSQIPEILPPGDHVPNADAEVGLVRATVTRSAEVLEATMTNSRASSNSSSGYLHTENGSNEMPSTAAADENQRSHAALSASGSSSQWSTRGSQNGESSRRQSWVSGASIAGSLGSSKGDPRLRMVIRQRRESQNLRELGEFLRSKTPPPSNYMSREHDSASASSLSDPAKVKKKKFSLKSVLNRKPPRQNKGKQVAQPWQHIKLPDTAVAGRTAAGHRHIAISIPVEHSHLGPEVKSQYPVFERENVTGPPRNENYPETCFKEWDGPLTGCGLRPVTEVSGELDCNEPDLVSTSQASLQSLPDTLQTAVTSQSSDFVRIFPTNFDVADAEDGFPNHDGCRAPLSECPPESWPRTATPMSELFVTAPNSVKSAPSSPFEIHTNGCFANQSLSINKKVLAAGHQGGSFSGVLATVRTADESKDLKSSSSSSSNILPDRRASIELAFQGHPTVDSPLITSIYTPPESPDDFIDCKDEPNQAGGYGRRLPDTHCLAKEADSLGEFIPGSPTSQKTITAPQSIDNVFSNPVSSMEIPLRAQDAHVGISPVSSSSSKHMSARKPLAPIKIAADFDMGERDTEPVALERYSDGTPAPTGFLVRKAGRSSQVLHPAQSTPTPWSSNAQRQAYQVEHDIGSPISPLPENILSEWEARKPANSLRQEPTPPESPENITGQAFTNESPREPKCKPQPPQRADSPATHALPQHDRISLSRRIERRKKLAAAAAGANQANLFASIAEAEAKIKALEKREASADKRNNSLYIPTNSQGSAAEFPLTPRLTTGSESAEQRVAQMEQRVRQLEQQLEQSGEAWMSALMPLLATLNKTLEGQRAQQDVAAENLRRQRRRSSASEPGRGWGRYDGFVEGSHVSRLLRNPMRGYLQERGDLNDHLFVARKGIMPSISSRQFRVLTPMDGDDDDDDDDDEEDDSHAEASLQRMRGVRRKSVGSTSTAAYYGNGRKASMVSQDFEDDYDCGPRRGLGNDPYWQGLDRFGQQPALRHQRFPSSSSTTTTTTVTESIGSLAWSSPGNPGRRQQQDKSGRRVSFASSMDFEPGRDDKKKRWKRRESASGAVDVVNVADVGSKVDDLSGLGLLMDELRGAARVSREFLPEKSVLAGED